MNENLKKALKITGIVGICALLFACGCGLGYCSAQKTGEPTKVLTEKSRKNAKTTTEKSGYNKYSFTIDCDWSDLEASTYKKEVYTFDIATATPTKNYSLVIPFTGGSVQNVISMVNAQYEGLQVASEEVKIIALIGRSGWYGSDNLQYTWAYISFKQGAVPWTSTTSMNWLNFLDVSSYKFTAGWSLSSNTIAWSYTKRNQTPMVLTYEKSDIIFYNGADYLDNQPRTFQDVSSYYLDQGYSDGYDDGELDGYGNGFEAGSGTGKMFTYLGVNQMRWYRTNLTADDQTDTSVTYRLLTFKDGQNASWSIYAINNISGTELDNLKINLYQGTTANSANFRTTLGTGTETTLASGIWDVYPKDYATFAFAQIIDVYNNSLVENYFLMDGIPENATGYQQGYQKGWKDGYNASPGGQSLDNVFSIFTKAFEATASFFNMKVFGFLPIYWFFLIPIFVAIITLLMRMIKH